MLVRSKTRFTKMPRTRSQQRAREGLLSLDDDALRNVLSFLSIAEGRRGAGVTSKALRQTVTTQLARARATAPYVLRGNTHVGLRHVAVSRLRRFGTEQWHKELLRRASCADDSRQCMIG